MATARQAWTPMLNIDKFDITDKKSEIDPAYTKNIRISGKATFKDGDKADAKDGVQRRIAIDIHNETDNRWLYAQDPTDWNKGTGEWYYDKPAEAGKMYKFYVRATYETWKIQDDVKVGGGEKSEIKLTKAEWRPGEGIYVEGTYLWVSELLMVCSLGGTNFFEEIKWDGSKFWGTMPSYLLDSEATYEIYVAGTENGEDVRSNSMSVDVSNNNLGSSSTNNAESEVDKLPWMEIAKGELGVTEIAGANHNPRIIEYHGTTTLKATTDETPWCSSFVNWCMTQANITGTNSASALSWKNWGTKLVKPVYGCIGVIDRGGGKGHVGFVVGKNSKGDIILLGGNQSNKVQQSTYPNNKNNFVAFVYPTGYTPSNDELPII